MSTATSASDRYAEASAALASFDDRTAHLGTSVETPMERRMAAALRALTEPAATGEQSDGQLHIVYNEAYHAAYDADERLDDCHYAGVRAVYNAGIQAGWNSWEPADHPGGSVSVTELSEAIVELTSAVEAGSWGLAPSVSDAASRLRLIGERL